VKIAKFIISFKGQISVSSQKRIESIHKLLYKSMLKLDKIIISEDTEKALSLAKLDDKIDTTILEVSSSLIRSITHKSKIKLINERVYVLKIIDSLEAAADHVVDICEIIIYIKTGTLHGLE
jgi:phosphate transport system protein